MTSTLFSSLVLALLVLVSAAWAEDPPEAPAIAFEGEARSAADLRAKKVEVEAELQRVKEAAGATPEAQQPALDALTGLAGALETAAQALEEVTGLSAARTRLKEEIEAEQVALQALKEELPKIAAPASVDAETIARLEAEVARAVADGQTAAGAVQTVDAAIKRRQADAEARPARITDLEKRAGALQTELDATEPEDAEKRANLERQLKAVRLQREVALLRQANQGPLLDLETERRVKADLQVQTADLKRQVAEARLSKAREVRQAQLAEEARQKEEETARRLREAELARSPAVKAMKRLQALRGRMESEERAVEKQLSELKTLKDEAVALSELAEAQLVSVELLYPKGTELESWQQESVTEQLEVLREDEAEFKVFERAQLPVVNELVARVVTDSGRLGVFDHRLESARARSESRSPEERLRALEQALATAQDDDYKLWLQARLDFLQGQAELRPEEAERLRSEWQAETEALRAVLRKRTDALGQIQASAKELYAAVDGARKALVERRRHIAALTFWLQTPTVFSADMLSGARKEAEGLYGWLPELGPYAEALPGRVERAPGARNHAILLATFLVVSLLLGVGLGRRLGPRPLPALGYEALDGLARFQRAAAVLSRALFPPLAFLGAVLYVRHLAPDGEPAVLALVALAILFLGWRLQGGLARAFFHVDQHGLCLAGCSALTARRARRTLAALVLPSAVFAVVLVVSRGAGAPHLARLAGFAWGAVGVLVAFWLVARRDVLNALIPASEGSRLARTMSAALRFVWPLAALFFAVVLLLDGLGYRQASGYLLTHVVLFALALVAIGAIHALLRALLRRRFGAEEEDFDADYDVPRARRQLLSSSLGALLTAGTLLLILLAIGLVFSVGAEQWQAFGDVSLTGKGSGEGLTIWRLVNAILILIVSVALARFIRDLTRMILRSRGKLQQGSRYAIRTVLFYTIVLVGALSALSALGLDMEQFGWFLTAAGVGIGFGLQEIISNFISGLILFIERPVQVGDVISVGEIQGDVQQINIRSTVVRTRDGMSIILPNKALITDNVVNWSHGDQRTRLQIQVGVAYGSDVPLVKRVLIEVAAAEDRVMPRPAPEVEFRGFGESELTFVLFVWVRTPDLTLRRRVRSDLNSAIDREFARHGITIPFPQRDLHIKTPGGLAAPPRQGDAGQASGEQDGEGR